MITLAEQDGGPDVLESFSQSVLSLRKLLAGLSAADYATETPRFSLILRVNGRLTDFGPEAVERPSFRRGYVQVDIVVPTARWKQSEAAQRAYLASVVRDAFSAIADALERKKRLLSRERMLGDFDALSQIYLAESG